jgi:hypothetical protein
MDIIIFALGVVIGFIADASKENNSSIKRKKKNER